MSGLVAPRHPFPHPPTEYRASVGSWSMKFGENKMVTRRYFIFAMMLAFILTPASTPLHSSQVDGLPNILFILADDLG
ncbi:MAG: hypothetical protein GTO26_08095, partial [Planctomycetales bacterium]|nr:hypothetical protein [Planctomycetales bacterium]